jgi:hypothetical protein
MLPPDAVRLHKTSGKGSPPTRHWKITDDPVTVVWFWGPRIKNGLTVKKNIIESSTSSSLFGNCQSLLFSPSELGYSYLNKSFVDIAWPQGLIYNLNLV